MISDDDFTDFVQAALPRLLRFAHVLTGNPAAAEDLVQTALSRMWRAWKLRDIDDPQAFVRKVMVNSYATWYRRKASADVVTADPGRSLAVSDAADLVDDRDAIWRALLNLPPKQRAVVVLRYYEELSESEIATVMGTTTGTVKSQAARALRRLAAILAAADPQPAPARGGAAGD